MWSDTNINQSDFLWFLLSFLLLVFGSGVFWAGGVGCGEEVDEVGKSGIEG